MHADHTVDDELQTRQTNTFVGQVGKVERAIRVAHVHHDLERQLRHGVDAVGLDVEGQLTGVDQAGVTFGTGHSHFLTVFQLAGSVTATNHGRDAQLAGNNRRVAGTAATVGDDGAGALHHRLPVRISHVRDQNIARLNLVHLGNVVDDTHAAGANALTNGTTFNQNSALLFQQVTLHDVGAAAAFNGFRTSLYDVQLAAVTVFGPLDIHRTTVVLLDDHRLLGQADDFFFAQAEAAAISQINVDSLDRATSLGFIAVDHLDRLAAQVAAQDRRTISGERGLVHIEFVRVDRALYHGLTQAVGAGDENHIAEARLGVQGKHDAGGTGFGAHHALHTGRQGDQFVIKALVHSVGDGTVVKQRCEDFLGCVDHVVHAANVQEGLLLAGKGGVRQVFCSSRRAHGYRQFGVALREGIKGFANSLVQRRRELGIHHPLANLGAGLSQGIDVIDVEFVQRSIDAVVQTTLLEKFPIGLCSGCKATGNRYAGVGQVADHFTKRGVLAAYTLDVVNTQLLEGHYVL